jgi:hypothetical protein
MKSADYIQNMRGIKRQRLDDNANNNANVNANVNEEPIFFQILQSFRDWAVQYRRPINIGIPLVEDLLMLLYQMSGADRGDEEGRANDPLPPPDMLARFRDDVYWSAYFSRRRANKNENPAESDQLNFTAELHGNLYINFQNTIDYSVGAGFIRLFHE